MGLSIIILFYFNFGFVGMPGPCQLMDGTYKVVYDQKEYRKSKTTFIVKGDRLTIVNSEGERKTKINWISEDSFRLAELEVTESEPTEFDEALNSLGIPYYELTNCNDDKFEFIHRRNLHITISSGKLVLID